MLLFAEVVFESFPGGGAISVARDGVSLGAVIAVGSPGSCPLGSLDRRDAFLGLGEDHFGRHNAAIIELSESLAHGATQRFLSLQET